jgi:hypothetical protein
LLFFGGVYFEAEHRIKVGVRWRVTEFLFDLPQSFLKRIGEAKPIGLTLRLFAFIVGN